LDEAGGKTAVDPYDERTRRIPAASDVRNQVKAKASTASLTGICKIAKGSNRRERCISVRYDRMGRAREERKRTHVSREASRDLPLSRNVDDGRAGAKLEELDWAGLRDRKSSVGGPGLVFIDLKSEVTLVSVSSADEKRRYQKAREERAQEGRKLILTALLTPLQPCQGPSQTKSPEN
jgi:hypothetical protein